MASNPTTYLNRSVLRLAVPSILANITIPLVGIVDIAVIGHIADAAAVGGIAVGTMLFDLLYWNFGFLRVGTSGMTAQAFGRDDKAAQTQLLMQSLALSLSASLVIWLLQWFFVTAVLWCMPCSAEVADFARRYFFVRIWAAPATLSLMAFKGWFIGMQNTRASMAVDILVNVVNMAASYGLAVCTPIGAIGVAWGTLIAQYSGLLLAFVILICRYGALRSYVGSLREAFTGFRRLFVMNGNLFIRSLCFMVVYIGYTSIASVYGDGELAVSAIMMKLFMFFSYFVDGFAYAGEALVGKTGALAEGGWQKTEEVRRIVRVLFWWAIGIGVLFSVIYAAGGDWVIAIMTDDTGLQSVARNYYIWLALMPIISSLAFMWDGVYIGATEAVQMRNCMIASAVGFLLSYVALYHWMGIQALYLAYFVHLLVRTLYLTFYWKKL